MAQKRMFSLKIIDTDLFLDMPISARLLYYDLSMRADDDGFVASPKKIQRMIGCSDDDFRILIAKQFIIPFESGICVIKHWRIHNYIQKDRYQETLYDNEKSNLEDDNGVYNLVDTKCVQNGYEMDTQVRLDKVRLDKVSIDKKAEPKKSKTFLSDSNEYRLSTYLFELIKSNNVQAKRPSMQKWSKTFDLMIRIDKRKIDDIEKVIMFSQKDPFWYKNILSADKLRLQFEKLTLQMQEPKYKKNDKESQWNLTGSEYVANNNLGDLEKQLLGWDK